MIDDDEFESAVSPSSSNKRAAITAAQFAALPAKHIPCGRFTLALTDGSRKLFRIRLERGTFCTGQRTVSIHRLVDPDTHRDEWESLAVVTADGFSLFKRWRGTWEERWVIQLWFLLNGLPAKIGYAVDVEPRCWMTMRTLTDDEGRKAGLCKSWRKRFGM